MLRLLLCLAAFLPAILAQGGSLETFEDVAAALLAGHRVSANFDSSLCESTNIPEPLVGSVHFDAWSYTEVELETPYVVALQSFLTPTGTFILVISYVDANGVAVFDSYEISSENGLVIDNFVVQCAVGVGAFFVEKGNHQPEKFTPEGEASEPKETDRTQLHICSSTALTSYEELLAALMEGRQLTTAATVSDCLHPLPPEVTTAAGGSSYYQFYVVPDETGEEVIIVEYPGLLLSVNEGETVYTVTRTFISPDGSVFIIVNYYNTLTWEDEYPYPEGYRCVLGESMKFFDASGDSYDSFGTYAELDAAFLEGKDIQVSLISSSCLSPNTTLPEVLNLGAKVISWVRTEAGEQPGIVFSQSIVDVFGDFVLEEFYAAEDDQLYLRTTAFNPIDPADAPEVLLYMCAIGEGALFSAPSFGRTELTDYAAVVEAEMNGAKLSAEIDFNECVDPTGEVDLSGVRAGAYLQDLVIFSPGTPDARLFGSAFALNSDPISVYAYESFGVTVDENNNAVVAPGYWHYNENGEWTNDFGTTILECTLGEGVMIFQEA
ncbi:unnamed protein product [Darwinula stevensoni]|uniref:Uncharacterized protein n=1 Tax=Darwinula stevensoni TaxID=69355 RepID=A0A7R9ACT5_9CRUS|nr:unnamed protein product [Darwinula stevensoni]CAG0900121.1 unnamed protein product [Darwinula stevensoni]